MLKYEITHHDDFTMFEFELDGVIEPKQLKILEPFLLTRLKELPKNRGIVFSGRGPIWLYCLFCHVAHPFAWVGVHDPRLGGAVVVMSHIPGKEVGEVIYFGEQGK